MARSRHERMPRRQSSEANIVMLLRTTPSRELRASVGIPVQIPVFWVFAI